MIADSLISQIQLALIGIVVVIGLFFVWRTMSRLEEKVDRLLESKGPSCLPGSNTCSYGWNGMTDDMPLPDDADTAAAEEFMRSVFGGGMGPSSAVVVEEIPTDSARVVEEPGTEEQSAEEQSAEERSAEEQSAEVPDHVSEAETDVMNPLSKSKLKNMNVDALKSLCQERGLSSEGSKNILINRLLGLVRD